MEIIIHGTKDGYKLLYSTVNATYTNLRDVRSGSKSGSQGFTIGQFLFSISYAPNGVAYTKYCIIKDELREAIGNIAVTVFIETVKKLGSNDIKQLLDELLATYIDEYVQDGKLGRVKENWSFVETLKNKYHCQNARSSYTEPIPIGKNEAGYIYYTSDEDLKKYFDNPFQDEYYKYKQVFLVKSDLEDKLENPLNASWRYDPAENLTGKVDLENKKYFLKEFYGDGKWGVTIEIWVNSRKCANGDQIKEKDTTRIKYSKDCYEDIDIQGKLSDAEIQKYLEIDGDVIRVRKEIPLNPVKKDFTIRVKDADGNIVEGARISCRYKERSKGSRNNQLSFSGEELKEQWIISATKGDDLITKEVFLTPKNVGSNILLILEEREKKSGQSGNISYDAQAGNHGSFKDGNNHITYKRDGSDLIQYIKAHRGYRFTHFEPNGKSIIAQYEKVPFHKDPFYLSRAVAGFLVILVVIAGIAGIVVFSNDKDDDISKALQYTEGVQMHEDTLANYLAQYCSIPNENNSKDISDIIFRGSEEQESGGGFRQICKKLEDAKKLRGHINLGKIDAILAMDYGYSEDQLEFKKAIEGIDSLQKDFIGSSMDEYKVSEMDLNQIANFIDDIEVLLSIDSESEKGGDDLIELKDKLDKYVDKKVNSESLSEIEKRLETLQDENEEENSEKENLSVEEPANSAVEEKVKVIPGKPISNTPPSSEANLENEFWGLIRSNDVKDQNFSSYATLLDKYSNSNSDIIDFIEQMDNNFSKFNSMNQGEIDEIVKENPPMLSKLKEEFNK